MRTLEVAAGPSRLWAGVSAAAIIVFCIMASVIVSTRSSASDGAGRGEATELVESASVLKATPAL